MIIRKTTLEDLDEVIVLYENARKFMMENGNGDQWVDGYPKRSLIKEDIKNGNSYVCLEGQEIIGTFYYAVEDEPTYRKIEEGSWLNDLTYGVVHRITTNGSIKGTAFYCINWCLNDCGNIKIDTHRNNIPMQNLLMKLAFTKCGIIHIENGDERLAYQKIKETRHA